MFVWHWILVWLSSVIRVQTTWDALLTCSLSMAVFKASWTSTGTVSIIEPGRNVCNLQFLLAGCTHRPKGLSQSSHGQLAQHLTVTLSSNCAKTLPASSMTWCCCSCLRDVICCRRFLHCCFWAASCFLRSSRSCSTWDMAEVTKVT